MNTPAHQLPRIPCFERQADAFGIPAEIFNLDALYSTRGKKTYRLGYVKTMQGILLQLLPSNGRGGACEGGLKYDRGYLNTFPILWPDLPHCGPLTPELVEACLEIREKANALFAKYPKFETRYVRGPWINDDPFAYPGHTNVYRLTNLDALRESIEVFGPPIVVEKPPFADSSRDEVLDLWMNVAPKLTWEIIPEKVRNAFRPTVSRDAIREEVARNRWEGQFRYQESSATLLEGAAEVWAESPKLRKIQTDMLTKDLPDVLVYIALANLYKAREPESAREFLCREVEAYRTQKGIVFDEQFNYLRGALPYLSDAAIWGLIKGEYGIEGRREGIKDFYTADEVRAAGITVEGVK